MGTKPLGHFDMCEEEGLFDMCEEEGLFDMCEEEGLGGAVFDAGRSGTCLEQLSEAFFLSSFSSCSSQEEESLAEATSAGTKPT